MVDDHSCSLYVFAYPAYKLMTEQQKASHCNMKAVILGYAGVYQVYYDGQCCFDRGEE